MARPGAISRAHRGVLFLDECAEIGVSVLEALRTPLEEGRIRLARRDGVACYPARFQLVLAAIHWSTRVSDATQSSVLAPPNGLIGCNTVHIGSTCLQRHQSPMTRKIEASGTSRI